MFIVLLNYIQPLPVIEATLSAHRAFLDKYYSAGNFITSGPQTPRTGGVILVKGLTRDELNIVITEDPFYQKKVATYQIIEFTPTKFSTGADTILT